ncbi:MAG: PA14 domain-containing protein [Chloroflexota bacterium]|nr:PA14 domain-containing protein [Chloroflexota bacterium]
MKNRRWSLVTVVTITLFVFGFGAPATPVAAQSAWYGEYFANRDLSGSPALTRYDDTLHFEWGTSSPGTGIPADNFSARWTQDAWFETGTYRFSYRSDDGIRLWVGDTLVVDDWRDRQATWSSVDHVISRGTHRVRVEYYEHGGGAAVQVGWERVSGGDTWRAEYFDNRDLSGSPVLVRYDPAIDFDWGSGSPDGAIPADNFSIRWTRSLGFTPGTYRFYASCDDGVRVYVDGNRVVDAWQDQKLPNTSWGDLTLGSGQHTVVVEYYEHGGGANAHVWWNLLSDFGGWEGRYYANAELRGGPALIRDDAEINFDWGEGAPADWMVSDNFSVIWTRDFYFAPGYYRFNVRSDDGVRVWLDGALVMDYWQPMDNEWHYLDETYLAGTHRLKVEYFERAGGARIHFWWERSGAAAPPSAPAPVTTPAPGMPGPWQGEYFDNRDLSGSPVLVRSDAALDFNWGWNEPASGVGRDDFSVRWSGDFSFESGRYRFTTTTDDGVRLYVDDRLVINAWRPMRGARTGYATLSEGNHTVRVEYFERNQAARARVNWQRVGVAPAPTPTPGPVGPVAPGDQGAGGPWDAAYYANRDLSGSPALTRQDAALDFDWGRGSPDTAVPADNFSAVWTRSVEFGGGRYTFTTYSDDGVRLYVDGQLVIDSWRPMRGYRSSTLNLSEGTHTVRLEYFERSGVALARLTWHRR